MSSKSPKPFELKSLPYSEDALEPAIGRETVSIHYHKHHGGYVSKLNEALAGTDALAGIGKGRATPTLESVIANARKEQDQKVFNLAAQIWNHDFYWASSTGRR